MKLATLPADTDKPCYACRRIHRKLYLYDGYWLGRNCLQDYELYKSFPAVTHAAWIGWERNHKKIAQMVAA